MFKDASFTSVVLLIVFIIVVIMYLISFSYNNDLSEVKKYKKKGLNIEPNTKEIIRNKNGVNINHLQGVMEHNCHIFETEKIHEKISYIFSGNFVNSCITLYNNENPVYSKEISGNINVLFTSNINLTNSANKLNNYKTYIIPVKLGQIYKISVSNVNNLRIQSYVINYDIDYKEFAFEYPSSTAHSEYDLFMYTKNKLIDYNLERVFPKTTHRDNIWKFSEKGKYALVYITNKHNLEININSNIIITKNNPNKKVGIELSIIKNPHIVINNKDYKSPKKNTNDEYIDFITSPNYLTKKFINGNSNNKELSNTINDKILIFKLV